MTGSNNMKLDGHAKITTQALNEFKARCYKATDLFLRTKVCKLPQFGTWDINWKDVSSNKIDNTRISAYVIIQEASIFREGFQPLKYGYLTREVVAVDVELWKLPFHWFNGGQKYHFLRRNDSEVTVKEAHDECVKFIYKHAANWISMMNRIFYSYRGVLSGFGFRNVDSQIRQHLRRNAASELALALHALQDSFSSGHTKRLKYTDIEYPGAISDIYIYAKQDKHKHSENDFASAGSGSILGDSAVSASADLLRLCARSVAVKSTTPVDWDKFEERWLKLSSNTRS